MTISSGPSRRAVALGGLYLLVWGLSTAYLAAKGADWTFPLVSLGVFGGALTGVAWFLTRRAQPPRLIVRRPSLELAAVLAFLAVYAVGFLGFAMGALHTAGPPTREHEALILAVKLAVHVAAPSILLLVLGAKVAPLFSTGLGRPGFWGPLIVLGGIIMALLCVVSPSLKQIAGLHVSPLTLAWAAPGAFLWMALEAGLCEEFLFRAVLQTRLAAVLRTEAGAVAIGALLFALALVPGLYFRGGPGVDGWSADPIQVAAYAIASLSPLALLFGALWARTRSLLLVVLLHASVDVLPNLAEFVRTWTA